MSQDMVFLLTGAGIGVVASVVGAYVQHRLALREDLIKRDRDQQERERMQLTEGVHAFAGAPDPRYEVKGFGEVGDQPETDSDPEAPEDSVLP